MGDLHYSGIAANVYNRVESLPTALSGTGLYPSIDEERVFVKEFTGIDPGSPTVSERYVGAITDLVCADAFDAMQAIGIDASSMQLAEFSVEKGGESNLSKASSAFRDSGMRKLRMLGRRVVGSRVIGGI